MSPPKLYEQAHLTFDVRVPPGVVVAVGDGGRLVTGEGGARAPGRPLIITKVDRARGQITLDVWPPEESQRAQCQHCGAIAGVAPDWKGGELQCGGCGQTYEGHA